MRDLSKRLPIRGRGYSLASKSCGPLACNTYAVVCESTKDAAVIDPSFSTPHEFQALAKFLEDRDANLKHVLLTHGHPDHVFGISELMRAWPQPSLFLHPLEESNYNEARQVGLDFGLRFPGDDDEALPTPTHSLIDGDVLKIGESIELSVVHTPGHAPGHVAFVDRRRLAMDPRRKEDSGSTGSVLISGDLLFHGSVGRTDFHNSSMDDLYASIRRLYELFDDDSIVLSGHTTPTFLKKERFANPFVDLALRRPLDWYEEARERHAWNDDGIND
mmetsp:Transcript_8960/g.19364  ORF Transcript_8960/g.19364 Transcript_8960/m.19364 type:complete len:275 (+) Transcript_8960:99-923(+)|eukprot:CAMPEP_0168168498 /NCGR_PEP_ID=MMETSP0139_2-20121125/3125_1 /TAXON_ID=44445 /ORGANISM="Pseudo-nitzschia australis, Strain 10249 10 AB" /LENGTH=274 /DNA_ID=CAMNT_0008085831 /DNA_START=215 /DNA_END=1039 /DNA_ORIENTATION=-